MSNREELMQQVSAWLAPLSGEEGPSGPDLEHENVFLELTKAAEGRPENQFDKGAPPDWRTVRSMTEELFERTRDLRIAVMWMRSALVMEGVPALAPGLHLVRSLLADLWDELHPKPDPDDNDPWARSNALALLPHKEAGVLGDLLASRIVAIKGLGEIRVRDAEIAFGNLTAREGEPNYSREQLEKMLATADEGGAGVRADLLDAQARLKELAGTLDERFGAGSGSDLKPLGDQINRLLSLTREPVAESDEEGDEEGAGGEGGGGGGGGRKGLSGAVNSRAEAVRAIEMICEYLERAEPTNPAPLFLRRARNLLERNFLELLKELAPDSLDGFANTVGVDPSTVGEPPS